MNFKHGVVQMLRRPFMAVHESRISLLILLSFLIGGCDKSDELARRLGMADLPREVEIARHWRGSLGPDRYELWQLVPVSSGSFRTLLQQAGAKAAVKRSMSGCLGLDSTSSPDWWPFTELEDASWDYPPTRYSLNLVDGHPDGKICIYRHNSTGVTYIQLSGD